MNIIFKTLALLAVIIIIPFAANATELSQIDSGDYNLEIATQEECQQLDGTWNECPPNQCQQTSEYQRREITCPDVCGNPVCYGLVPAEDDDLSQAHNPYIDQEIKNNPDAQDDTSSTTTNNNSPISQKQLTVLVVIGLVLALIFILLKLKKDGKDIQFDKD